MNTKPSKPPYIWHDGICKLCGCSVEEGPSHGERDYANRCVNVNCDNHAWHFVWDDEILEYYDHK